MANAKTTQSLLIFTSLGNVIYRPVHELADIRWKDLGEHLSQSLTNFAREEAILFAELVDDFETGTYFAATKEGQIKRFERKEFAPWRTYKTKSLKYAKLKGPEDGVVAISPIKLDDVMLITAKGYGLRFNIEEVPIVGAKAAGVKSINLKEGDYLVSAFIANTDSVYLLTQRGSLKRMVTDVIPVSSRAKRGLQVLRELKTKPHRVFAAGPVYSEQEELDLFTTEVAQEQEIFEVVSNKLETYDINLADLPLSERTSNGSFISETISEQGVLSARIK